MGLNGGFSELISLFDLLPGVPIFFFVSGFLISKSYEGNPRISEYTQNRVLRIYPALILCTILSLFSVYVTGYFTSHGVEFTQALPWIISQLSFAQFYTPNYMREYGVGTLNGSLWTITVELQFYIVAPLVYYFLSLRKDRKDNIKIGVLIVFFIVCQRVSLGLADTHPDNIAIKLLGVSFVPWVYMFLLGILFQRNFDDLHRLLSGKAAIVLPLYLLVAHFTTQYAGWELGGNITPALYLLLAITVFSVAYTAPAFSKKAFKGNDLSYGIYIYHLPVINLMITYGLINHWGYVLAIIASTCALASMSWFLLEKPSLALKRHPFNPLNGSAKGSVSSFNSS